MEKTEIDNRKAGFWVRFAATWVDLFIVWVAVRIAVSLFRHFNVYVPLEITVILFFLIYSVLLIGWRGSTIGKLLCGLTVQSSKGKPVGYVRAFLRETIGKFLSAVFLFLGFVWVAFSRKKRGWHDYIIRTNVKQDVTAIKRARWLLAAALVVNTTLLGSKVFVTVGRYNDAMKMAVGPNANTTYSQRAPSSLVEVSSLEKSDHDTFVKWLDENGKDPVDYAVEVAKKHQITIFGEVHHVQDNLLFLNRIIPDLYHRAGVTCIAMETCVVEDQAQLDKLVTSDRFDSELALQIARDEGWKAWGDKEYWDVFKTVWQLNKSLPEGKEKMRVIGIDFKWDGPSFGMTGTSQECAGGPPWEKLRFLRLFDDFPLLIKRDEVMARNVEKEIIEKGKRGIVWVGLNHDYINYRQARIINKKVFSEWSRMGFMLHQKYGDQVYHIRLHTSYNSPKIAKLIEKIAVERENAPVGFDVVGSPFALLRNSDSGYFRFRPGVCFSDVASGYVYLKPENKLKRCAWLSGYISRDMFIKNKPFYEAECGHKLNNAKEANKGIASKYGLQFLN
jgi:uncharacterized RDD family membrane protein YckC